MKSFAHLTGLFMLISSLFFACSRSQEFRDEQVYEKKDPALPDSPYYSSKKGSSATSRAEKVGQPKKKVLIFNFWNDTPVRALGIGAFAADELKRGVAASQRMVVPSDVNEVFATENYVSGDKVKISQVIREGRKQGVSVVIIGRISKIVFRQRGDEIGLFRHKQSLCAADVELKVFDINTGKEVLSLQKSGEANSNNVVAVEDENLESQSFRTELAKLAIRDAMSSFAPQVMANVEKMVWEGRVVKVSGQKIYVNAGRSSGLILGDILKVMTGGDELYDPTTGAFLGRSNGQLKGTVEIVDFIGQDAALSELHSGANINEGDTVQLY